jgi:hypothetical protein
MVVYIEWKVVAVANCCSGDGVDDGGFNLEGEGEENDEADSKN